MATEGRLHGPVAPGSCLLVSLEEVDALCDVLGVVVAPELPEETGKAGYLFGRSEKPARLVRVVLAKLPTVPHHKKFHHHTFLRACRGRHFSGHTASPVWPSEGRAQGRQYFRNRMDPSVATHARLAPPP